MKTEEILRLEIPVKGTDYDIVLDVEFDVEREYKPETIWNDAVYPGIIDEWYDQTLYSDKAIAIIDEYIRSNREIIKKRLGL